MVRNTSLVQIHDAALFIQQFVWHEEKKKI